MAKMISVAKIFLSCLLCIFFLHELGDGLQLHIAGALIDGADFGVPEEFLLREISCEANSSHKVDAFRC